MIYNDVNWEYLYYDRHAKEVLRAECVPSIEELSVNYYELSRLGSECHEANGVFFASAEMWM